MTTTQIQSELVKSGKKLGLTRLYYYLKKLQISPFIIRQRPQRYPDNSADRILNHLGISAVPSNAKGRVTATKTNGRAAGNRIVSLKKLKRERSKAK